MGTTKKVQFHDRGEPLAPLAPPTEEEVKKIDEAAKVEHEKLMSRAPAPKVKKEPETP